MTSNPKQELRFRAPHNGHRHSARTSTSRCWFWMTRTRTGPNTSGAGACTAISTSEWSRPSLGQVPYHFSSGNRDNYCLSTAGHYGGLQRGHRTSCHHGRLSQWHSGELSKTLKQITLVYIYIHTSVYHIPYTIYMYIYQLYIPIANGRLYLSIKIYIHIISPRFSPSC